MKFPHSKTAALLLCASVLCGLCGCKSQADNTDTSALQETLILSDDHDYALAMSGITDALDGTGQTIAYAADADGLDYGRNAVIWQAIQSFADANGFTVQSFSAEEGEESPAQNSLRQAATSGAGLVVCAGDDMANALYTLQDSYPGVSYLLLDGEPHAEDYTSYKAGSTTHCVLFEEQDAGFLAGYAAVMNGYTRIAIASENRMPQNVRYCAGFLQGAEQAAENQGVQVNAKLWCIGDTEASDQLTEHLVRFYEEYDLIYAVGDHTAESCAQAAEQAGKKMVAAGWDRTDLGNVVLGSSVKRYNLAVQRRLYDFFSNGASWTEEMAASTENLGYSASAVALTNGLWQTDHFGETEYLTLYRRLRNSDLKVERISDLRNIPEFTNLSLTVLN